MKPDRERSLLRLLLHAYPDRVTVRRVNDPGRGVMVGGRGVALDPASVVQKSPLFLSIDPRDVVTSSGVETRVRLASGIEEPWLEEVHPHLVERRFTHRYDDERKKVVSLRETRFAALLIREDAVGPQADPQGASKALFEALRPHTETLFLDDDRTQRLLLRLRFLRRHVPELNLADFDTPALERILEAACDGCASLEQVRAKGLRNRIEDRLTRAHRQALEEHAPDAIQVPSGSRIRLQYPSDDSPPVLAVRLQEVFGWKHSPRVARGRIPILLHLLGPNFRPVQITRDLENFWNTTYAEVRRDLRARYPRHPWPEDPWKAPPVAVGGRKRS